MRRHSEAVLNGHPDKFCDLLADRILKYAYQHAKVIYAQIEVSVWSDQLFINGSVATETPLEIDLYAITHQLGDEIGYTQNNHIDVKQYKILDLLCRITDNSPDWYGYINDQCIIHGYAGYDQLTNYLPPEQFAIWYFREHIIRQLERNGILESQGPDGKLILVMDEVKDEWKIKSLLFTLQQKPETDYEEHSFRCIQVLKNTYQSLQKHDKRWSSPFEKIQLIINPNGIFIRGGSDGDNGQTGRKLVMDFYGPRIPIGGGALYGKCVHHIDRMGSFAARELAIELVKEGSKEAMVRLVYGPGMNKPFDIQISSEIKPKVNYSNIFDAEQLYRYANQDWLNYDLFKLGTFYNHESNKKEELKKKLK